MAAAPPKSVPFPPAGNRNAALHAYLDTMNDHDGYRGKYGNGKEIVGQNNIGEITFNWGTGEDKTAIQELWWWLGSSAFAFPLSRFPCPLGLLDSETF